MKSNWQPIGQDLLISSSITLPPAGRLLKNAVGEFIIPLQASLDGNTDIIIKGTGGSVNIPYLSSPSGACSIFYLSQRMPISCNFVSTPTQLDYTLIIN